MRSYKNKLSIISGNLIFLITLIFSMSVFAADYYVSTTGSNSPTNGSEASPWATIDYAVAQIPPAGGHTIIVKDGTYTGQTSIREAFDDWITIKAENPYQVKLTNPGGEAFGIFEAEDKHIIVEGFIFSNKDPSYTCSGRESHVLFHIESASYVTLHNNIFTGNTAANNCNELLKINRGDLTHYPREIHVKGNLFYDRPSAGGTDLIDSVRPGELDIYDNIFFEVNSPSSHSFITVKRQAPGSLAPGGTPRSPRFKIYRNVFLNYDGAQDQAFIQLGEDTPDTPQISDALVENNLFIGNSGNRISAAFQYKDTQNIVTRANTITGNMYFWAAYGFRINTEIAGWTSSNFDIVNNIFSDHTGTMGVNLLSTDSDINTSTVNLDNNIYFNDGESLPDEISNPSGDFWDANRIVDDPLLERDHSSIVLPVYNEATDLFPSGNGTIRREFERLVHTYGAIPEDSPAKDAADAATSPGDDILGMARDSNPDIGAFEFGASEPYVPPDPPPANDDDDDDGGGGTGTGDGSKDPAYNPFLLDDPPTDESLFTISGGCGLVENGPASNAFVYLFALIALITTAFIVRPRKNK